MFLLSLKPGDTLIFLKILMIFKASVQVWNKFIDPINNILTTFHCLKKINVYIWSNYCYFIWFRLKSRFKKCRHWNSVFSYVVSELSCSRQVLKFVSYPVLCTSGLRIGSSALKVILTTNRVNRFIDIGTTLINWKHAKAIW